MLLIVFNSNERSFGAGEFVVFLQCICKDRNAAIAKGMSPELDQMVLDMAVEKLSGKLTCV